jgi:hypothetical protein
MKHNVAEESARLILATDDQNYYYIDFMPVTKWKTEFSFDVGFIQNIEFEEVGSPGLTEINFIGVLYPSSSQVEWCKIDELRFEGESEAWGVARDEAKIAEYGFQPEKVISSAYKTPEDAQLAAEYFLELLKTPPLVKGSVTHPWGLLPLFAGDSAIVNVPNQSIDNEELTVKEVFARLPPGSSIFPMSINVAGLPSALTDPQKRLRAYIERLQKADVYSEKVEAFTDLKDSISIADTLSVTAVILRHFKVDALLVGRFSKAFQADAILVGKSSKAFLADAFLVNRLSKTLLIDAFLKGKKTKLFLIDAILKTLGKTKTFSADAVLLERILWEEFANMNDWTSRLGTWGTSSGWLEQTDDVIEYSVCDYTGSVDFPPDYFIEFVVMAYDAANDSISVWTRWDGQYSGNADCYDIAMDVNDDKVKVGKIVNGSYTEFANASKTINADTAYKIKCAPRDEDSGVRFKVWFESESSPCINYLESTKTHSDGKIACFMYS